MNTNTAVDAPAKPEDKTQAEEAVEERAEALETAQGSADKSGAGTDTGPDTGLAESAESADPSAKPAEASANAAEGSAKPGRTPVAAATAVTTTGTTPGAAPVPEPRVAAADTDAEVDRGKSKRPRKPVKGRSAGGTKALVVWQQGRVHYADDSVLVIDLDEATSADLDVHDLVDRLTELREAADSPGRTEAVAALVEIIQDKALN
jgi:hypothetical protein